MEVASILVVFSIRKEALTNWKGKVGIRNRRYLCRQAPWWHSIRCWKVIQRYSKHHIILYSHNDISLCRLVDLKPPGGWFEVLKDLDCATRIAQLCLRNSPESETLQLHCLQTIPTSRVRRYSNSPPRGTSNWLGLSTRVRWYQNSHGGLCFSFFCVFQPGFVAFVA